MNSHAAFSAATDPAAEAASLRGRAHPAQPRALPQTGLAVKLLRKILRKAGLLTKARGWRDYLADHARFSAVSSALDPRPSLGSERAQLTKCYHRLEKGMALPEPRPGFGWTSVEETMARVARLEAAGAGGTETEGARGTLQAYLDWHGARDHALDSKLARFLAEAPPIARPGGTITLSRDAIQEVAGREGFDFDAFARSRYSIRQLTGEDVTEAEIGQAVATALKTPCVCNRESRHVFVALTPEMRARLLSHQNGNRGFGHLAGAVVLVAVDQRAFTDFGERNQGWIDGGLFTMSLVYALHGQGLGTCLLNWSADASRDRALRAAIDLPDHLSIITMLAVGRIPPEVTVAWSPRPAVDEVFHVLT